MTIDFSQYLQEEFHVPKDVADSFDKRLQAMKSDMSDFEETLNELFTYTKICKLKHDLKENKSE